MEEITKNENGDIVVTTTEVVVKTLEEYKAEELEKIENLRNEVNRMNEEVNRKVASLLALLNQ